MKQTRLDPPVPSDLEPDAEEPSKRTLELFLGEPTPFPPPSAADYEDAPFGETEHETHSENSSEFDPPPLPHIPFSATEERVVHSLTRWVGACGLLTLSMSGLFVTMYVTGDGLVPHMMVGILAGAVGLWLLGAAWHFRQVVHTDGEDQNHLISGFGFLRTALLLKATLVFGLMVIGCFTLSLAASILFLL